MHLIIRYMTIRNILQESIFPTEIADMIMSYDVSILEACEKMQNRLDQYIHALGHFFRVHYRDTKYHNDAVKKIVLYLFRMENKYIDDKMFYDFLNEMLDKMKQLMEISGYDRMKSIGHEQKMDIWVTIMLYTFLIDNIY